MSHPSRIYQTILSNLRPEINSLHKHFSLKKKISFGESITVKWRLPYLARSVIFGHLRKQVRHSLIHQVGHIKVHHASLDTRTGKPPYCFPSYTYKKIIPIKHQATANILFLSTKGVILKLCVQIWFNKVSFSQLFFNIIKNWIKYEFKKKIYWTQKIQWW